jgi:hypothetical protein
MNYPERKQYQQSMIQLCCQQQPEYFVTLAFHNSSPIPIRTAEPQVRHFGAMLDRALLGPGWAKAPSSARTHLLAIPEGRLSNTGYLDLHYHLLLRPTPEGSGVQERIKETTMAFKAKCLPTGSVDIQRLETEQDRQKVASYVCKYLCEPTSPGAEHFIVLPRVMPDRPRDHREAGL